MDGTTATTGSQAAYGSYLDNLISQAGLFGGKIEDHFTQDEMQQGPLPAKTAKGGQLASTHRARLTNNGNADASAYGVSPLFMSPASPALQPSEVFSGTATATPKPGAMPVTTKSTSTFPDAFQHESACMQAQEFPSSCAAATAPTSASPLDLLNAGALGASISSASASSISSLHSGGEASQDFPTSTVDNMFDFDFSAYDSMLSLVDHADSSASLFSNTHLPVTKADLDLFDDDQHDRQNQNQDQDHRQQQQQQQDGNSKLTSWTVQRSASSSASSDSSDSMSSPQSSDEKSRSTSNAAAKRATPSPRKARTRTRRRRQGRRRNDAGKNVAKSMCTMRGRSAINKRCVLDNGDIDHEKLERTRQIARRSYWRRRNAEMREQEQIKGRLDLLDKTKDALLSQKADLVSEREYLLHQLKAHVQTRF